MASPVGRRELLRAGGTLLTGTLAGCGYVSGSSHTTIRVRNMAKDRRSVALSVLDPDGGERSDATWFSEQIRFEERDDGDDVEHQEFEDAFEMNRAIVEVKAGGYGPHAQFTYYPYCDGRDDLLNVALSGEGEIIWDVACDARDD